MHLGIKIHGVTKKKLNLGGARGGRPGIEDPGTSRSEDLHGSLASGGSFHPVQGRRKDFGLEYVAPGG
eukprot:7533055-Alexandrium_andersonii.AAC.1